MRAPVLSLFIDGCIEKGMDISDFATRYYNHGCHGAGISNAADALAAVKKVVFDEGTVEKSELLKAMEVNFEGYRIFSQHYEGRNIRPIELLFKIRSTVKDNRVSVYKALPCMHILRQNVQPLGQCLHAEAVLEINFILHSLA